jgi:hypothetical protein
MEWDWPSIRDCWSPKVEPAREKLSCEVTIAQIQFVTTQNDAPSHLGEADTDAVLHTKVRLLRLPQHLGGPDLLPKPNKIRFSF